MPNQKNYPLVLRPAERKLLVKCLIIAGMPWGKGEPLTLQEECQVRPLLARLGMAEVHEPNGSIAFVDEHTL